jgi:hypothetical protein
MTRHSFPEMVIGTGTGTGTDGTPPSSNVDYQGNDPAVHRGARKSACMRGTRYFPSSFPRDPDF